MPPLFSLIAARRAWHGVLLGCLCGLLIWGVDILGFSQSMERSTIDALFRARGVFYPSPSIVVLEADDSTITRFPWPLPRRVYGTLIRKLTRAGARVIAFDVLFPTPSGSVADDAALIEATRESGKVIHSAVFSFESHRDPSVAPGQQGNADTILKRYKVNDRGNVLPETVWGSAALAALQLHAAGLGHLNAPPEDDGVLRRIPHLLRFQGGASSALYPSLALASAARFLGLGPGQIIVHPQEIILPAASGTRTIPLDNYGRTWVNWIGPHNSFPTYSFNSVLDGTVPDEMFKDKVVLIGITAAGSFERHATPFSGVQPAVELQANALDDILMNRPLRAASNLTWMLLMLGIPAFIGAVTIPGGARLSGFATLTTVVCLWVGALICLTSFRLVLPVATPMLSTVLAWGACLSFRQYLDASELRRAEERYALAVRGANDGLWDWDLKSGKVFYSPRWKSMLGYEEDEIGADIEEWYDRVHSEDLLRLKAQMEAHFTGGSAHFESQHRMRHHDGRYVWVLSRGLRVTGSDGHPARMAGSQSDISLQVEARQQLERNALYDVLTGLPNRALFMEVLARALARVRVRQQYQFAVLFLDLDRFKMVNDSLGHSSGDDLLVTVARRLESCLRPGDVPARLGGDEFTVLLDDIEDASVATTIADRIQRELAMPFLIGNQEVFPTSSVGIAISSTSYRQPEDMLRDADTAMYRAKSMGRARHAIFDEKMHDHVLAQLRLETDLRRGLERQEFEVYYQPIVHLESSEIYGFEALVRWNHPERGLITPGEFVALSEETGLIVQIDHYVLHEACRQTAAWREKYPELDLFISVNLSSKQFTLSNLVSHIQSEIEASGLPPDALKLEITESALMDNPDSAAELLQQLRDLDVRLSIDDFGTGYSSLSYLQRFPLDTLKVDQSFVKRIGAQGENLEIVRTIVTLAHNLDMDVVAEGVETPAQLAGLRAIDCAFGQGYFFARPLAAAAAEELLDKSVQDSPAASIWGDQGAGES